MHALLVRMFPGPDARVLKHPFVAPAHHSRAWGLRFTLIVMPGTHSLEPALRPSPQRDRAPGIRSRKFHPSADTAQTLVF